MALPLAPPYRKGPTVSLSRAAPPPSQGGPMDHVSLVTGNPSEEPPTASTAELFWRVAVRLFRDLSTQSDRPVSSESSLCERCRQAWPCSGRRLAVLGLLAAVKPSRALAG